MYKYVAYSDVRIKTPHVEKFSDIKISIEQTADRVYMHEEFPNGLILDIYQYADRIEYTSNKRIIADENLSLTFED